VFPSTDDTPAAVQGILNRLRGVTRCGSGWKALCPAHPDNIPSLAVAAGTDGTALVRCHAGCTTASVVQALGLTLNDLFPPKLPVNGQAGCGVITAVYDYRDERARVLYQTVRFRPKGFRQRRPDGRGGWTWRLDGTPRVLYHLPELLAADPAQTVYIVEGEKDADALAKLGLVATTNPCGAGQWKKLDAPTVQKALGGKSVVVIADNDPPGREHAQDVAQRLQGIAAAVRVLALPGLPLKGDVSDWIAAGGTPEQLHQLAEAAAPPDAGPRIDSGASPSVNGHAAPSPPPPASGQARLVAVPLAEVRREKKRWLWYPWLPESAATLIDGDPGLGKSTITDDLAARLTRGWDMPPAPGGRAVRDPAHVLIVSAEDDYRCTIRPRLDAAGADPDFVTLADVVTVGDTERPAVLPTDLNLVEELVRRNGVKLVVIDPLMAFLDGATDAHKDQDVRRVLHQLKLFCEHTGVAVLVVRHLNKMSGASALYRGGGSIGIVGAVRAAWVVGRDPSDRSRRVLAMNKSNLAATPRSITYSLDPSPGDPDVAVIGWGAACDLSADDILSQPEKSLKVDRCAGLVRDLLAGGPVPTDEVERRANQAGFSARTVRRACNQAGVVKEKEKRAGGRWLSTLSPDGPTGEVGQVEMRINGKGQKRQEISEGGQIPCTEKFGHLRAPGTRDDYQEGDL
jgi:hypothetical protein